MGYIGNEPTTGHFPVDNFTSSGGSTYTLTKAPASAGAIEVSVQGVLQPTTAYTVSGTTLNMAGVTTGVKIFVRHLGETLSLPTPADGSVTTAKLGVNAVDGTKIAMGSDARGDILYHGATDYARLAKGTSGQVLTMGANDPAWAAAGGGAWAFVSKTTITSSTASVEFTGLTTDKDYMVSIVGHLPVTDNTWRVGHLGVTGPTYRTSNYLTKTQNMAGSSNGVDDQTANMFDAYGGQGNATDENGVTTVTIYDPANASTDTYYSYNYGIANSSATTVIGMGFGHYTTSEAHTAIKFTFSSGNIASGVYRLYSRTIV